ncbi:MAG: hypothetical protein ACL9RN_00750 [Cylindrospermopsis raciborskii]|jgi:hypothetical protein|uniref:hypothetical protein n=1 Tax=Cylindrospermopsis raciborskii TaxID=77022 RepID=UPI003D1385DF
MTIWIVTAGNSDVILKEDYSWSRLYEQAQEADKLDCWHFGSLNRIDPRNQDAGYSTAARVLGIVYEDQLDDNFEDLSFPLLDNFTEHLKSQNNHKNLGVERIIMILTNQKNVFTSEEIQDPKCPYWQDTCKLKPIFKKYFQEKFSQFKGEIEYLEIEPSSPSEGIDNWDKCLRLVNRLFEQNINNINKKEKIFVSHQAGTPAISSAVQFASLAKFETQVEFLVSNEYQKDITTVPISNYLIGLRIQEAKELLDRYDYHGVEKIFKNHLWKNQSNNQSLEDNKTKTKELIEKLLAIAIDWNNTNLGKFSEAINAMNQESKNRTQQWWWMGYEAGYLAVVRFRQGDYVESLFHSFRAIEGLLRNRDTQYYEHKNIPDLIDSVLPNWELSPDIRIFRDHTSKRRNYLFHNLRGLKEQQEVFEIWKAKDYTQWQNKIIGCLNFITKQEFNSLEKASLMSSVHEELKKYIHNYDL